MLSTATEEDRMAAARFGIVGVGFRTGAFRKLAGVLGEHLELVGVAVRSAERAEQVRAGWGVPAFLSPRELLGRGRPDFVVTSLPWDANPGVIADLVSAGAKVLSETPPAAGAAGLRSLWDEVGAAGAVQVAEQYPMLPGYAARAELVRRGIIGRPTNVQVSSTQTYHAVALIRSLLGIDDAGPVRVSATAVHAPLLDPLSRAGWTGDTREKQATTTFATLDFGDGRSGLYDFTTNQTRNQLRHRRTVVRGSRGEISGDDVVYARDAGTIVRSPLVRQQLGYDVDPGGYDTELIAFQGEPVWRNPFLGSRLMDDEIATGELLLATARWATGGGPAPYPLSRACQDHLLGLAIEESAASGTAVGTGREPWAA
jgi:predicted dehydrogenase